MARDIEVDLHVNDDTAAGLNSAARRLEEHEAKIRKDADKTSKAYSDRLLKSVSQVSPQLSKDLEKVFKDRPLTLKDGTKEGFEKATANLKRFEDAVKKGGKNASKNFAESLVTAVKGVAPDIAKKIEQAIAQTGGAIQGLGKKASEEAAGAGGATIRQFGSRFLRVINDIAPEVASALANAARLAGPPAALALLGAVVGVLPVLGGALAGAVVGAGAATGIVGGVLLAARDPRIQVAGKTLGANLLANFTQDATPLMKPILEQIGVIQSKFISLRPTFRAIFEGSASLLGPLIDGVLRFTTQIAQGIKAAVEGGGPAIDALANGLDYIGQAVNDMFTSLADDGVSAAAALDLAFKAVAGTIKFVTNTVEGLTKVFGLGAKFGLFGPGVQKDFIAFEASAAIAKATAESLAVGVAGVGQSADGAAGQVAAYTTGLLASNAAMEDAANKASGLFGAVTDAGKAYAAANEAVATNGRTLSENTKAGQANRDALKKLADSIVDANTKLIESGANADTVGSQMENLRGRLYNVALGMTGSATEATKLTNQLLGIPDSQITPIATPGMVPAITNSGTLTNKINNIPGSKNTKINANTGDALGQVNTFRNQFLNIPDRTVTLSVNVDDSRLASVERRLARVNGENSGVDGFAFRGGDEVSRTGGARGITVESSVAVNLDGRPFRDFTERKVRGDAKRTDFRNRVGRRDSN